MTHTAGWPLGGTPGASGGADSDVVDVGSALYPAAVHVPSFVVSLCAPRRRHLAWPEALRFGRRLRVGGCPLCFGVDGGGRGCSCCGDRWGGRGVPQ